MIHFTYSFCMALLHSLWQAALLLFIYEILNFVSLKNHAPLARRNFLFLTITAQLILFAGTFSLYYYQELSLEYFNGIAELITQSFQSDTIKVITPWIFTIYLLFIILKLIKAFIGWRYFKNQFKNGLQKPAVELKLFTELKAHHFGIKRNVKLWLSNTLHTPMTFGYFKPIILLPVSLINNISTKQAETLILHELAHIQTHDYLLNWFLVSAETIFFFNPFVKSLCKKIKFERELHCDMRVISFEYTPTLYAETLLQAACMKKEKPAFQLAAVNNKKDLLRRIRFFTDENIFQKNLRFNILAPSIGLILFIFFSVMILLQSHKISTPAQMAMGVQYIPSDNYMMPGREYFGPIFTEFPQSKQQNAKIPNHQAIKKSDLQSFPKQVCKPMPANVEESNPIGELNYAKPIAVLENEATTQIIIKEEGAGNASVKVYTLSFKDGSWTLQPEWVLSATEIKIDSLSAKTDSLHKKIKAYYPAQQ